MGRVRLVAGNGDVVRSVGISAVAIALAVYAMVGQKGGLGVAALGCTVLLIAASATLQVGRAVRLLHRRQDQARRTALRAERHYFKVLRRIVEAFEAREPYCRGRSKRVSFLARRIAEQMGLDGDRCRLLAMAAKVQDIGLLAVPDRILNKPSRLGGDEYRTVKKHPETSYRILEPLTFFADALPAVRYHHERMNGSGYPFGKAAEEVPMEARILAVAEAYEAMTHDRPHRSAMPSVEALNELRRCSPEGYDSACVAALEKVLNVRALRAAHRWPASPSPEPMPAEELTRVD
ncbi:MAG TPA: HD-GYP domain-containing protein [Phycisphaerae bacterium]|nr:HD-GYP domain-containing protein [Phycisphaerae bacterium]HUU22914.1 HD-GYP domain-containing protein [Phycisphaerae bacterium]